MRKRAFSFFCDGCGAQDVDMAYICSTCDFMVHKTCASLPLLCECHQHHHHRLSLAFSFPEKHRKYRYKCDVCDKLFDRTCWVYYCDDCRYFVHLKCVKSTPKPNLIEDDDDVIQFPLFAEEISNKLITPFVMRSEKGEDNIPIPIPIPVPDSTTTSSNSIFIFKYHEHPLSLVWESEAEAANDELKICDVCVSPITSHPYYNCSAYANCCYSIHYICCFLPNTLHPNSLKYGYCPSYMSSDKNHNFTLYAPNSKSKGRDAISYWWCHLCGYATNGMGYECKYCGLKIDVKCASLPTTIRHAFHLHHKPLLLSVLSGQPPDVCGVCNSLLRIGYCCSEDDCDFKLGLKCVMLPKSIREREWDKHPVLLMSDASLDHPSDFFCEHCEIEMDPKKWMYHCRQCDVSFHLDCLRNASGSYRNVKFGRRYELDGIHLNHPLTFTYITLKRRCDLCQYSYVYRCVGLECASCYYVVCQDCGGKELEKKSRLIPHSN